MLVRKRDVKCAHTEDASGAIHAVSPLSKEDVYSFIANFMEQLSPISADFRCARHAIMTLSMQDAAGIMAASS